MHITSGKYIVFSDGTCKVFDQHQIHAFMTGGMPVSSAGFFEIKPDGGVSCWGESTTLGVKSHPDDSDIIAEHLEF